MDERRASWQHLGVKHCSIDLKRVKLTEHKTSQNDIIAVLVSFHENVMMYLKGTMQSDWKEHRE